MQNICEIVFIYLFGMPVFDKKDLHIYLPLIRLEKESSRLIKCHKFGGVEIC